MNIYIYIYVYNYNCTTLFLCICNGCFGAFCICQVKPKADGTEHRWEIQSRKWRAKLGCGDADPWTCRQTTRLRGLSRQLSEANFLSQLVNIRFIDSCRKEGKDWWSAQPCPFLMVDTRQEASYQLASGLCSMVTNSKLYHYASDRCIIPLESLAFLGWGRDCDYDSVTTDPLGEFKERMAEVGPLPKKKRGRQPGRSALLQDLAGNGVCLPDISMVAVPLALLLQCDAHRSTADFELVQEMYSPKSKLEKGQDFAQFGGRESVVVAPTIAIPNHGDGGEGEEEWAALLAELSSTYSHTTDARKAAKSAKE